MQGACLGWKEREEEWGVEKEKEREGRGWERSDERVRKGKEMN